MRKIAFVVLLALAGAFVLIGFPTAANNAAIGERFALADKTLANAKSGKYNFDKAHSSIGFRVKHMGLVDVPGYFRDFTGSISFDAADISKSTVEFTAKATSVDTGVAGRDTHLRSADFFDVATHPDLTFKSTRIEKKGKQWMMTGDLTMRGVTKSVSFPFNIAGFLPPDARNGAIRMGATAETVVNRRDYGVNYGTNMPNGVPTLSDNVRVVLNIEAILPAPPKS